jgi:hypothetical protein
MLLTHGKPECVVYIHLRVSRYAFDNCVSCWKAKAPSLDLSFTGYNAATCRPLIMMPLIFNI